MRGLKRNEQKFYYCTYTKGPELKDEYGNATGENIPIYSEPVAMWANISPASGAAQKEQFGNLESYDKVIATCDMSCPIDEDSVLFIDTEPSFTEVTDYDLAESDTVLGDEEIAPKTYKIPKYDYIVRRVAKSLNSISIAVRKVEVS